MFPFSARLVTFGDYSPWSHRMTATGSFAGATTHRMIDRVFSDRTAQWPNSSMPAASGFAQDNVLVLGISDLANRGVTVFVDPANFARRQTDLSVALIARHKRCRAACSAN